MKTTILFAILAGALCVAGCDEKSSGSAGTAASASVAPTASTPPPPASTAAATPAPSASVAPVAKPTTEEDFEAKATTAVTPPTVDQQLNELDKEIGQ
ncbi:MAG: hypothetical protein ACRELB_25830 [Polyangiaceae bacterium]